MAVVGPGQATDPEIEAAEAIGRGLAEARAIVVCGGLGGVMAAACRGASANGGLTVGILPGPDRGTANPGCRSPCRPASASSATAWWSAPLTR